MTALICGSLAYDNIMVFQDRFKNHILPDKVHILNVCFLVPDMRREYGGCAGNIAYNLQLLGGNGKPMGTVGSDFGPYGQWIDQNGVSRQYITQVDDSFTAQAFITTDLDDNQITAFHPGAMNYAHTVEIPSNDGISLGLVSPDGRDGMIQHAEQFANANIPFIFDPGQGLPMFESAELLTFLEQATYVTLNDYESQLTQERTQLTEGEIAERVDALIITRGGKGSTVYTNGKKISISAVSVTELNDPTGCGDAYRAGLIFGLMNDMDWETTCRIASLLGAIKIQHHGTQNHTFSTVEFADRFKSEFGYTY